MKFFFVSFCLIAILFFNFRPYCYAGGEEIIDIPGKELVHISREIAGDWEKSTATQKNNLITSQKNLKTEEENLANIQKQLKKYTRAAFLSRETSTKIDINLKEQQKSKEFAFEQKTNEILILANKTTNSTNQLEAHKRKLMAQESESMQRIELLKQEIKQLKRNYELAKNYTKSMKSVALKVGRIEGENPQVSETEEVLCSRLFQICKKKALFERVKNKTLLSSYSRDQYIWTNLFCLCLP